MSTFYHVKGFLRPSQIYCHILHDILPKLKGPVDKILWSNAESKMRSKTEAGSRFGMNQETLQSSFSSEWNTITKHFHFS